MKTQTLSLVLAAASSASAGILPGCASAKYDSATDFFTNKWTDAASQLYPVTYNNTFVTIRNRPLRSVVLYCTAEPPPASEIGQFATTVRVPVTSVAALDGLSQNIIDMLGMSSSIKRVGTIESVTSACIRGNVADNVTYDSARWASAQPVGVTFSSELDTSSVQIVNDGSLSPLQQAAYIRFIGLFYGLDELAASLYNAVAANYRCAAARVDSLIKDNNYLTGHLLATVGAPANLNWWRVLASDAGVELTDASKAWGLVDTTQYGSASRLDKGAWVSASSSAASVQAASFAVSKSNVFLADKAFNPSNRHNFNDRAPARPDLALNDLIAAIAPTHAALSYESAFLRAVTYPSEITDQRRLREICVAPGRETPALGLATCTITPASPVNANAGLVVNAAGRGAVRSDAEGGSGGSGGITLNKAQIAGIVVGSLVALLSIVSVGVWLYVRRRAALIAARRASLEKMESVESFATVGVETVERK